MPRVKTLPDAEILQAVHRIIHGQGPDAVTFQAVAGACGLSPSTLVQRFGTKSALVRAALLQAWDRLDELTARLAAEIPRTSEGAIALLVGLSGDYGGIESYANGLLVLREDFRDPVLRARGAAWKTALTRALDDCLSGHPGAPPGLGLLMASQWQGSLLWWGFEPQDSVERYVEGGLRRFVDAVLARPVGKPDRSGA